MKKYSITFGFSITIGRKDCHEARPANAAEQKPTDTPHKPVLPEPVEPFELDDSWVTPPEIKAIFDKRQAEAAKTAT
ncbi:MAG TPA: hypothetical protein H9915_01995 [Candidatus Gemmiger faecigallinarum]|nr:hypothetical protein [Candidatus Gemmiger faecigallinarum]